MHRAVHRLCSGASGRGSAPAGSNFGNSKMVSDLQQANDVHQDLKATYGVSQIVRPPPVFLAQLALFGWSIYVRISSVDITFSHIAFLTLV